MPFGLANTPATLQNMMHEIVQDIIDLGVIIYLYDIFIYSEKEADHIILVMHVLSRHQEYKLVIAPEKYKWHKSRVSFLDYIISADGVEIDWEKIKIVLEWDALETGKDIQSFLGFRNFYRQFIQGYSMLTRPLTNLTKKSEKFFYSTEYGKVFQELKSRFTSAPILRHFDPHLPYIIEYDTSDFAISTILLQKYDGCLHPVAFHSWKMNKHEIKYDIHWHDKELLAITSVVKEWRWYLKGTRDNIIVYMDYRGLEWFTQNKLLNQR